MSPLKCKDIKCNTWCHFFSLSKSTKVTRLTGQKILKARARAFFRATLKNSKLASNISERGNSLTCLIFNQTCLVCFHFRCRIDGKSTQRSQMRFLQHFLVDFYTKASTIYLTVFQSNLGRKKNDKSNRNIFDRVCFWQWIIRGHWGPESGCPRHLCLLSQQCNDDSWMFMSINSVVAFSFAFVCWCLCHCHCL